MYTVHRRRSFRGDDRAPDWDNFAVNVTLEVAVQMASHVITQDMDYDAAKILQDGLELLYWFERIPAFIPVATICKGV